MCLSYLRHLHKNVLPVNGYFSVCLQTVYTEPIRREILGRMKVKDHTLSTKSHDLPRCMQESKRFWKKYATEEDS